MTQDDSLLRDMAARLFADLATPAMLASADAGTFPSDAWAAIEAAGLHMALLPEAAGGFGVAATEALGVLREAGAAALPLPLGETMLAVRLLAEAGLPAPAGPLTFAAIRDDVPALAREGAGWRLQARLSRVPWGRDAAATVVQVSAAGRNAIVAVPGAATRSTHETNMAGEPRDTLVIDARLGADDVAPSPTTAGDLRALGAALRCQQIAGAIGRICDDSVRYAQDRAQFGRAIGRFQAVQQNLAILAGQAAATLAAADLAAESIDPVIRPLAIAAAKARAGEAAGLAAAIAHQIHGAIGFTHEHRLHYLTRRLWSWRDEFGNETVWNALLGRHLAEAGPDRLWAELTAL